jgi:hypothetical protein
VHALADLGELDEPVNVHYRHHQVRRSGGVWAPSRPVQGCQELVSSDPAFGSRDAINEDDRHAPVVQLEEAIVGIDVGQLRLEAKLAEETQGVIAEVTALARDEDDDSHGADPSER